MYAVVADNISKHYGKDKIKALDNVSFEVNEGEIFGVIGPDGAGKSSLFRILTTLLIPDSGKASVIGKDVVVDYKDIRNAVGYMPGRFSLYPDLTVEENLHFFATVFNTSIKNNYHLIQDIYVQLEPFKNRRAGKLSGGMKQKLALCCALVHKPRVLFLDEPTTGVDPVSRKEFWQMLARLKEQNITIIVSTPYMDEATLCDRIALIQNGKILEIETPQQISASFKGKLYSVRTQKMSDLLTLLKELPGINHSYAFGDSAHVVYPQNGDHIQSITSLLVKHKVEGIDVNLIPATIEDRFIQLMKDA